MIRQATFGDIPALARLMARMHALSRYAGRATLDDKAVRALFMDAIRRHGGKNPGSTLVLVSEVEGELEGMLVGVLDTCYHVLHELYATDLYFWMSDRAHPRDAWVALKGVIAWAESNERVIEIRLGITDAIGDPERAAKLYERFDLKRAGLMMVRELR